VRAAGFLLLLLLPAAAAERDSEAELLERWAAADPDERRRLAVVLDRLERARRFSEARPVLVEFDGRALPLAELFAEYLEPALRTAPQPTSGDDPGLTTIHIQALTALGALRGAYAPPRPARTGTLNLLLGYAWRALTAPDLTRGVRLRFFTETIRNVRQLDGRVEPDARTKWIIHHRLLPALLALARRVEDDDTARATVAEAASLLYLPSILDARAQVQLAPLTSGTHSRDVLVRFYREGMLDDIGLAALARSVTLQAKSDVAFIAGAAPLILELLSDPQLRARERRALLGVVLERLAPIDLMRTTARDLLAAGFGGPPLTLPEYRERLGESAEGVPAPRGGRVVYRFLSIVLVQADPNSPPAVERVVRADLPHHRPLHVPAPGGGRRFVGVLVPDAKGRHADFLGPPPGLTGARDRRLLRRHLDLERVAIRTYGARGEEIELCVTLPEDQSEPVPARGANLSHVLALVEARLKLTPDTAERRELVRLLVRIATDPARALAVRHAAGVAAELLPLAERGDAAAAGALLERLADLDLQERARALHAALARPELVPAVRRLCGDKDVSVAVPAGAALLAAADVAGAAALLRHPDKYARLSGAALVMRATPLAGGLKVVPKEPLDLEPIAAAAAAAFTERDGAHWVKLGRWLGVALRSPASVRELRRRHAELYLRRRRVLPYEFATAWTRGIRDGKAREDWGKLISFLLDPHDPGRGILDRDLGPLLDALEARVKEDAELRRIWVDCLTILAAVQYGMEADVALLDLAHVRLARVAGESAPPEARRKAGVFWPIWAARDARK
jgi:hypothetical protein